jgi:hypothetical protein
LIQNRDIIVRNQTRLEGEEDDFAFKEKYATVPCLGTRVCRGPHWGFQNQDNEGYGTIVGHGDKGNFTVYGEKSINGSHYMINTNTMHTVKYCKFADPLLFNISKQRAFGCKMWRVFVEN